MIIRHKSLLFFLLAITGCALNSGVPPPQLLEPDLNKNLVINGSFDETSRSQTIGWQGSGCIFRSVAGRGQVLELKVKAAESTSCRSEPIKIVAGHYEGSVYLSAKKLALNPLRELTDAIQIRLHFFNDQGIEIESFAPFRAGLVDTGKLDFNLHGIFTDHIVEKVGWSKITLVPRFYPFDSGWIGSQAKSISIEFILNGPGTVLIDDLDLRRSRWNIPLMERVKRWGMNDNLQLRPVRSDLLIALNSDNPSEVQLRRLPQALRQIKDTPINSVTMELTPDDIVDNQLSEGIKETASLLASYQEQHAEFTYGISYHLYWGEEKESLSFSDGKLIPNIQALLEPLLKQGARYVMIRSDDLTPNANRDPHAYYLDREEDRSRFGDLAGAHIYLLTAINSWLSKDFPGVALYFVPPWYNGWFVERGRDRARKYNKILKNKLPSTVGILWTGPAVRSFSIDTLQIERYKEWLGLSNVSLWDNTPYGRRHKDFWLNKPERIRLNSYFEPYSVSFASDYLQKTAAPAPLLFLNGGIDDFTLIQHETAAIAFADPQNYQPETALWHVLKRRFGGEVALLLLEFDQILWECRAERANNGRYVSELMNKLINKYKIIKKRLPEEEASLVKRLTSIIEVESEVQRELKVSVLTRPNRQIAIWQD